MQNLIAQILGGQRFIHKLLRVYPMVFVSILICLVFKSVMIIITNGQLIELWRPKVLVANFALLFAGYPYFEMLGINNPTWYICVLIQCYILYYIFEYILKKIEINNKNLIRMINYMVIIAIAVIMYHSGVLSELSFRGIVSFSIGILICILNQMLNNNNYINEKNKNLFSLILFILAVISCGTILLGMNQRWVLQFLVFPFFVWSLSNAEVPKVAMVPQLGDISFEVYIIHYPLMVLLQLFLDITRYSMKHSYLTMMIFLIIVWGIAWVMWKYIDLPIRKKVKGYEKKYE